jgi:methylase of polypeptide subunit release factors
LGRLIATYVRTAAATNCPHINVTAVDVSADAKDGNRINLRMSFVLKSTNQTSTKAVQIDRSQIIASLSN